MKLIVKLAQPPTIEVQGQEEPGQLAPGFIHIGDQYYDVGDNPGVEIDPKDIISAGEERYKVLSQQDKNKILEALINEPELDKDGKDTGGKKPKRIKMNQIKQGDEVTEINIIPHHWLGESPIPYGDNLPDTPDKLPA